MAAEEGKDVLECWLNKATDPSNTGDRWDCIQRFYEQVNKEKDGPQMATRLLAHKIQSPQEKEALQALMVLEACMNNCGKPFHTEAGKFRFLNELIKVLSPKYLGMWSTEKVKLKVTEVLYGWTQWLKDEVKIQDAYHMLKKQGIVKQDPKLSRDIIMPPPSPRGIESIFDNDEKSKLLDRLLKSQRPDDLQAANLLIKSTMKEEQERAEKVNRRVSAVEEVDNSTKCLRELLDKCRRTSLSAKDQEEMKSLFERCNKMKPLLFRLASDTVDDDTALAEILQANDKLILAVNLYQEEVAKKLLNCNSSEDQSKDKGPIIPKGTKTYHLIDLSSLDDAQAGFRPASTTPPRSAASSLLDDELMFLGLSDFAPDVHNPRSESHLSQCWGHNGPCGLGEHSAYDRKGASVLRARGCHGNSSSGLKEESSLFRSNWPEMQPELALSDGPNHLEVLSESTPALNNQTNDKCLSSIFVPLESIKPSGVPPITIRDKDGVRVMLHLARDPPAGRPDVVVMVISMLSTSPQAIKDILIQAAVPKTMLVKLQSASGSELPAFSPLRPPVSISQILLLSNPLRGKVRLRYKLTFNHGEQKISELGEVDGFPSERCSTH